MADAKKTTSPQSQFPGDLPGGVTNVKDAAGVTTSSTPPGIDDPHE